MSVAIKNFERGQGLAPNTVAMFMTVMGFAALIVAVLVIAVMFGHDT